MKHTPAPWSFQQVGSPGYFVLKGPNLEPLPETVDNARVKAAAPKLLDACQLALDLIRETWVAEHGNEQVGKTWGALEDAIAQARGAVPCIHGIMNPCIDCNPGTSLSMALRGVIEHPRRGA